MRFIAFATAVALLSCASASNAQSIEETYANLCSKGAAKQGETCIALRKAMLDKLNAENAQPTAAALPGQATGMSAPPAAATQTARAPYWGHYLDFIAQPRLDILAEGRFDRAYASTISTYSWDVPGEVMAVSSRGPDGSTTKIATLHWSEQHGGLVQKLVSDGTESVWKPQSDGSLIQETDRVRIIESRIADGVVEQRTEVKREAGWGLLWRYHRVPYTPASEAIFRQIHNNAIETAKIRSKIPHQYFDPVYQREVQARADALKASQKKLNSAVLGGAVGAAVGLAAGAQFNLGAEQTVGAMMKGASVANPTGPVGSVLSSTGDQLLGGGASGASQGGPGGAGAPGSYPTKANLALGSCSGFSEGNYRTKALEGGGDSQLKTMCGQAFEFYTMYKRAIAQGYSEADANRTYAAHQQASEVANGYRSSHAAN